MTIMTDKNKIVTWKALQFTKDFCDVTLVCDDKQIKAHKTILSSSSHLFRNILKDTSMEFPLINLVGVKYPELVNMLHFMYQGEVNIDQEDLHRFLAIAEDFKIKGIFEESRSSYNYVNLQLRYPYSNLSSKGKSTNDIHQDENVFQAGNKYDKNVNTFQKNESYDQLEYINNINLDNNEDILRQVPETNVTSVSQSENVVNKFGTFNKEEIEKKLKMMKRDSRPLQTNSLLSVKSTHNSFESSDLFIKDKQYYAKLRYECEKERRNITAHKNNSFEGFEKEGGEQIHIKNSTVHQEFTRQRVNFLDKFSGKERFMTVSKCNHCKKEYIGKNPTTLKFHLEKKHSQVYEEVIKKDIATFKNVNAIQQVEKESSKNMETGWHGNSNPNNIRVKLSSVHKEFTRHRVKTFKKKWGRETLLTKSKCNHCSTEYFGKNPSTLKLHLEVQHYQIYEKVMKQDSSARRKLIQKLSAKHLNNRYDINTNNESNSAFIEQSESTDIMINQKANNNIFNNDLKKEIYKDVHLDYEEFNNKNVPVDEEVHKGGTTDKESIFESFVNSFSKLPITNLDIETKRRKRTIELDDFHDSADVQFNKLLNRSYFNQEEGIYISDEEYNSPTKNKIEHGNEDEKIKYKEYSKLTILQDDNKESLNTNDTLDDREENYVEIELQRTTYKLNIIILDKLPDRESLEINGNCAVIIVSDTVGLGHIDTNKWGISSGANSRQSLKCLSYKCTVSSCVCVKKKWLCDGNCEQFCCQIQKKYNRKLSVNVYLNEHNHKVLDEVNSHESVSNKSRTQNDQFDFEGINVDDTIYEEDVDTRVFESDKESEIVSSKLTSKDPLNDDQILEMDLSSIETQSLSEDKKEGDIKQPRVKASAVHKEFTRHQVNSSKPSSGKERVSIISKCNHCENEYQGKNTTTLKTHLEGKHFELYEEVIRIDNETRRKTMEREKRKLFDNLLHKGHRYL